MVAVSLKYTLHSTSRCGRRPGGPRAINQRERIGALAQGLAMTTRYLEQFDQTPAGARWPLVRRWMYEESLPFFAEVRAHRPILETPEVTVVTRFADCAAILRRYDAFSVALYKPKQGD